MYNNHIGEKCNEVLKDLPSIKNKIENEWKGDEDVEEIEYQKDSFILFPKALWEYLTLIKSIISLHTIGYFNDLKELKQFLKDDEIDKIYRAL